MFFPSAIAARNKHEISDKESGDEENAEDEKEEESKEDTGDVAGEKTNVLIKGEKQQQRKKSRQKRRL